MARKTKHEQNKEKAAKQKKIAIGGAVLLVGLLAIQVPRTMKMMNGHPAPPVVSTTTPGGTTTTSVTPADPNSLAAPTLAGSPTTTTTTTTTTSSLVASVPVEVDSGQLATFQRFASKDPFASQAPGAAGASSGSSTSKPSSSTPHKTTAATSTSGSAARKPTTTTPVAAPTKPVTPAAPAPTIGVISLNGALAAVGVGTDFPATSPVFHLLSLTATTAKVAIAGGSYADGSQALTLKLKTPVTLQNTADGTKYTLILEPPTTPVTAAPSTTTPASTTPASVPAVPAGSGG